MADNETPQTIMELSERLLKIVNHILAEFNRQGVTPTEAGTIIMALTHRLLGVLEDNPEAQRAFVASLIEVVNEHLLGRLKRSSSPTCQM